MISVKHGTLINCNIHIYLESGIRNAVSLEGYKLGAVEAAIMLPGVATIGPCAVGALCVGGRIERKNKDRQKE